MRRQELIRKQEKDLSLLDEFSKDEDHKSRYDEDDNYPRSSQSTESKFLNPPDTSPRAQRNIRELPGGVEKKNVNFDHYDPLDSSGSYS